MASLEEHLSRAVAELQALERAISDLQSRVTALRVLMNEYDGAISLLDELKRRGELTEVLVPIGGGNFIHAEVKRLDIVEVSIGSGIVLRKSLEDGRKIMEKRKESLSRAIELYENRIVQYAQRADELRRVVNALAARLREKQAKSQESKS